MIKIKYSYIIILCSFFGISSLAAQHHSKAEHHDASQAHNFHAALFAGFSTNLDAEQTDLSVGGDLEYRLPLMEHKLGIGILADIVLAGHTEIIIAAPFILHPAKGFKIFAAPGIAMMEHIHVDAHGHEGTEKVTEFVLRTGAGYDFHLYNFSVTPTFSADYIDEHVSLVYGIALGMGF